MANKSTEIKAVGMANSNRQVIVFVGDVIVPMSTKEYLHNALVEKKYGRAADKLLHIAGNTSMVKLKQYQEETAPVAEPVKMIDVSIFKTMVKKAFDKSFEVIKGNIVAIFPVTDEKSMFLVCKLIEERHLRTFFAPQYKDKSPDMIETVTENLLKSFNEFSAGYFSFHINDVLHFPGVNATTREELLELLPENLRQKLS